MKHEFIIEYDPTGRDGAEPAAIEFLKVGIGSLPDHTDLMKWLAAAATACSGVAITDFNVYERIT